MEDGRILLKKLHNTRDLGGFSAADGKTVSRRRLIRSGALCDLPEEDLHVLTKEYGVRHVIDLRTPAEITDAPDTADACFSYESLSLLDDSFLGIARDEYSVNAWFNLFSDPSVDPDDVFMEMYRRLLFSDRVRPLFRRFFEILLHADGAVLWHCSAGKDRAGIASVLVLSALGVSKADVIRDYMLTGVYTADEQAQAAATVRALTADPHMLRAVDTLMGVKEKYVEQLFEIADEKWGGMTGYIQNCGILSSSETDLLRDIYLT